MAASWWHFWIFHFKLIKQFFRGKPKRQPLFLVESMAVKRPFNITSRKMFKKKIFFFFLNRLCVCSRKQYSMYATLDVLLQFDLIILMHFLCMFRICFTYGCCGDEALHLCETLVNVTIWTAICVGRRRKYVLYTIYKPVVFPYLLKFSRHFKHILWCYDICCIRLYCLKVYHITPNRGGHSKSSAHNIFA